MMIATTNSNNISTYPGAYTPIQFKFEKLKAELAMPHEGAKNPPCNICETHEYYKIELAVPGLQRQDFFAGITADGFLSVAALHKDTHQKEKYRKHSFNYECFSRILPLPANINTDFIKAEYKDGILAFWFLKTRKPYQKSPSIIVIY